MNEHTDIPTTSAKKQYILGHTEILERPIANIQRQFTTCSSVAWTASKPLSHLDNCAAISQTVCAIHGVHSLFIFHAPHKFLRELRLQKDCVWYSSMEYQAITIIFPKQIMMLQSQRLPLQHLHYTTLHVLAYGMFHCDLLRLPMVASSALTAGQDEHKTTSFEYKVWRAMAITDNDMMGGTLQNMQYLILQY